MWSARHHFRPFFALLSHYWFPKLKFGKNVKNNPFTHMHHKSRSYEIISFFVMMGHFLPFDRPNNWKNQSFEKIKKTLEILWFTTNDDHMMYSSWDIKRDRQFFLILDYFLPFHLPAARPNNPKNQNFENIKKSPGDIILHMSAINKNQKSNDVWFLRYRAQQTDFVSFWTNFYPFTPPLTTQGIKILKKWKKKKKR